MVVKYSFWGAIMNKKFTIYNGTLRDTSFPQNFNALLADLRENFSLSELFTNFEHYLNSDNVAGVAVCLYEQPLLLSSPDDFPMPNEAILSFYADLIDGKRVIDGKTKFDPAGKILPDYCFEDDRGDFELSPISFDNKHFGYFVSRIMDKSSISKSVMMDLFSSIIVRAVLNTNKVNLGINTRTNKDALTNIFNRQGFMDAGQDTINLALKMSMSGIVAFADMDNLRQINDNYGHDMGDKAIQTLAEVFQIVFRKNDVFGRLGEDEFAAVLPGLDPLNFPMLQAKLDEMCAKVSEMKRLPFVVQMSLGAAEFDDDNYNLEELLKIADDRQYIEKKQKHSI